MFMQKRCLSLFKLLNEDESKISCKSLSETLKVSERTIRTDIALMNSISEKHGASIKVKRGEGYYIDIFDLGLYQKYLADNSSEIMEFNKIPDSPMERNKYVLKYILYNNDFIKVEDLADKLYVSKITILNDIKKIKTILSKYNLNLISKPYHGMKITGKEIDIRKCISDNIINRDFENYLIGFTDEEKEVFNNIDLAELESVILDEISKSDLVFSDFNLKNFMIHTAIVINRIINNHNIDNVNDVIHNEVNIDSSLSKIFNYIETKYNLVLYKGDKKHIYNHYISKSKSINNNIENIDSNIVHYIQELLEIINDTYNFDLRKDDILFHDLILHFKSILNSKHCNLNTTNPLLKTIKSNYPLAFEITFTSIEKVFKNSIYTLNEDEVGYVSLHIGAAIERFFQNNLTPKNTVIVCGSGYGTSRLLEAQINKVFHDKLNILECLSFNQFKSKDLSNIELIISTIPINNSTIPVVLVDFALLKKDIQKVSKAITNTSITSNKILDEYFDENFFIIKPIVKNKSELLNLMCDTLINNGIVLPSFKESIFYRENLSPTNLDDFIAIPHPMELKSIKTKILVCILDKPILWNEKNDTVKVVMMLAINKDDYFEMDLIYDVIINIINNSEIKNEISSCSNFESFFNTVESILFQLII